eukprot:CAMPEP_0113460412 /NCGR_PEP_ID=MMETSP0014_2-20120614/10974_1 /TAXON_ID=2857 /ORGANISM="Nitzschia sp." /LENGTH=848 /DNA_ID=CAMNT_0000352065 /DNA_START=76 /DNA_END=2619 /DNA_ORIENTATION=- /assembly_acc=CAM_ASM_000159
MDTRTSKRNQEEKAETETPPSKKTKPVDPPDGSPSGTIETPTVMSFKDDEKLSKLLSEDDFKEGQGVAARSFLEHSIGKIRQERRDNSEMWQDLCSILRGPDRLSARLDETSTFTRMAEQNYGFNETMAHELDVQALEARLREVEKWHQVDKVRDTYLAPLLAIIQSSGTGKSRLMNVVRNNYQKEGSRTILLNDKPFDESRRSLIEEDFDEVYIVNKNDTLADQRQSFVGFVKEQCKHCSEKKNGCVRLFFDEAQHLAHNGGFLIRVLRWMTREKKFIVDGSDNHCKLTVVLAGTNSALANFFPEEEQQSNQSRTVEATGGHYENGTVPFPPFFMLRTMPSGTIETTTVMSFKDDEKLSKLLSEDDFNEQGQGLAGLILENTIGTVRQHRRDNPKIWQNLCSALRDPGRLSARLDETSTFTRVAEQNYGFDETMAHELDVQALEARLREVEKWHQDEKVRDAYLAPLLAIIQSSGTGKSRLMNVVRNNYQREGSRTILLDDKPFDESRRSMIKKNFDEVYIVNKRNDTLADRRESFVRFVKEQCNDCSKRNNGCVRLFFDEAQHLAHNGGFLIRVLRWMTREKKFIVDGSDNHCKLTVVLAGTNSALANFFPEEEQQSNQSRTVEATGGHYENGTVPFPPFFMLRTMGCLSLSTRPSNSEKEYPAKAESEDESEQHPSEYESMIQYSRPLFAKLHKDGRFHAGKEYEVVKKVVLGHTHWKNQNRSCLSVLGTRIQMGPTSAPIVSDLVSKGYAHLTYYEHGGVEGIPNRASFAFLPDPVCARIAMCLMDNDFKFTTDGTGSNSAKIEPELHGATKKEMAKMMGSIFSQGVCQPAKGDFGEVASALYL